MTKKHFIAVAETLAAIRDKARREEEIDRWIPTLQAQNPRFNAARFRAYVAKEVAAHGNFGNRYGRATRSRYHAAEARRWERMVGSLRRRGAHRKGHPEHHMYKNALGSLSHLRRAAYGDDGPPVVGTAPAPAPAPAAASRARGHRRARRNPRTGRYTRAR